jgi:hypothetical protein
MTRKQYATFRDGKQVTSWSASYKDQHSYVESHTGVPMICRPAGWEIRTRTVRLTVA